MNEDAVFASDGEADDVTVDEAEVTAEDTESPETADTDESEVEASADDDTEGEDDSEDGDEPEEIEFNFHGKKLRVAKDALPEELATEVDQFVRNAESVTARKLQDVAERSKSLEAREAAVEKITSINGEVLDTYSRGLQLKSEIEQLSQLDLNAMWQSNPDQARRVSDQLSRKQAEFQRVVNQVSQKEGELTHAQQEERSRRIEEGKAVIESQVKGFATEKLPEVIDYAVNALGMDKDSAESDWALNPALTLAVWKASQFDKMQSQASKPKPKPKPAEPVKGRTGKGGKANRAVKDMSTGDLAKYLGLPG